MDIHDARVGQRVGLHPATSLWMRGVRFADIVKVGREFVTIEWHGRRFKVRPIWLECVG